MIHYVRYAGDIPLIHLSHVAIEGTCKRNNRTPIWKKIQIWKYDNPFCTRYSLYWPSTPTNYPLIIGFRPVRTFIPVDHIA